jgi:hypothetical protein
VGPDVVVPFMIFGGGTVIALSFSPVGRALARRLGGREAAVESAALAEVDALRDDLQALRHEVGDLQERLDFAERLLAQARDQGQLGQGGA